MYEYIYCSIEYKNCEGDNYMLRVLGGFLSRVVFKSVDKTENGIRWYWQGRPEKYSQHSAEEGLELLRYVLY